MKIFQHKVCLAVNPGFERLQNKTFPSKARKRYEDKKNKILYSMDCLNKKFKKFEENVNVRVVLQ